MPLNLWLAPILGYLLGSIPSGYLLGRLVKGVNLPAQGYTTGTLSVIHHVGVVAGLITLTIDLGKGVLAVLIAQWMGAPLPAVLSSGLAAVIGHNWPLFTRFRGGRGLATAMAVLLAVMPLPLACSLPLLAIVWLITHNISLAGGITIASLPLIAWLWGSSTIIIFYPFMLAVPLAVRSLPDLIRDWRHHRGKPPYQDSSS